MQPGNISGFFAQAYGQGSYGSNAYQEGAVETTTGSGAGSGGLADTGTPIVIGGTVGVSLILCAVILFVQSRKKKD